MEQRSVQAKAVYSEELAKVGLVVSGQQFYPSSRDGLVENVRHCVVRCEFPDAASDECKGFVRWVPMQLKPSQSQVIPMPEGSKRQGAIIESYQELFIVQSGGSYDNSHY
jgi:hypothetical protein